MNHADKQKGFTLIELVLAMGFVAALLIAITMTVIQIGNIYNRGLTLKDVNQAGRSIASELQRSIAASTPFGVDPGVGSHYLFERVFVETRYVDKTWGGRLCVGQYSYIWNYGKSINDNPVITLSSSSSLNVYGDATDTPTPIRFVKVIDPSAKYCDSAKMDDDTANGSKYIYSTDSPVELLDESQHNLAIHSFKITTTLDDPITLANENTAGDAKTNQQLYSIEFVLGTNKAHTLDYTPSGIVCKPPSDPEADPAYCSINQFNIVVRSGNAG